MFKVSPVLPATVAGEPTPDQGIAPEKKLGITISEPVLTLTKTLSDLQKADPIPPVAVLDQPTDPTVEPYQCFIKCKTPQKPYKFYK